jgi:hypothetical protein
MHTTCLTLDLRSTSLLMDPAFCRRCCRCCRNPRVDRDTWYPFFSKCGQCRGYIFGASSDMQRQLGACGCLVALRTSCQTALEATCTRLYPHHAPYVRLSHCLAEMELSTAPTVKALTKENSTSAVSARIIEQILKRSTKIETPRAGTTYLSRSRRPGREPPHKLPSKQVGLVRHRLPRDLPRRR